MMFLLALLACRPGTDDTRSVTEIGNPEMIVSTRAISSMPDWVGVDSGAVTQVRAVWMVLSDLAFVDCQEGGASSVGLAPRVVEIVSGSTGEPITVPEASYCGLEQSTALGASSLPAEAPAQLAQVGLFITGFDATARPFELQLADAGTFSALGDQAFSVDANSGDLLLTLDLARWFAGSELVAAEADSDSVVRLGVGSPQVTKLAAQLDDSAQLIEDLNSDGQADPDELSSPLAGAGAAPQDGDGDGLIDSDETDLYSTDPARADSDGDGLLDGEEVLIYQTDPNQVDTDGGGVTDGAEVTAGTDPLNPLDDR